MIAEARRRAPELEWLEADLVGLALDRQFDVVVLAGNVPLFTDSGTEHALVAGCATHVAPDGVLVAGFQLGSGYPLTQYDESCARGGTAARGAMVHLGARPLRRRQLRRFRAPPLIAAASDAPRRASGALRGRLRRAWWPKP